MTTKVTFRVVGIYCYFPYLELPVEPTDTVQQVMDAIKIKRPAFNYACKDGTVDMMSYDFSTESTVPPNVYGAPAEKPKPGPRDEEELVGSSQALAWQYYRSVSGTIGDDKSLYEIKIVNDTSSQPKFSETALNWGEQVPSGFSIVRYNLTWRLLKLQLSAEGAAKRAQRMVYQRTASA